MAFIDKYRDRWEQMAPRERRLVSLLGVTFVICLFGYIGFQIRDGLTDLETRNARTRAALESLDHHRDDLTGGSGPKEGVDAIGDEAVSLATYLEKIANEVGVPLPETSESTRPSKGKFQEHTIDVTLRNITIEQLAMFLKRVETDQPAVVTQHLNVKPYRNDHVHMDVELTIATYSRTKPKADSKDKDKPNKSGGDKKDSKDGEKGGGG